MLLLYFIIFAAILSYIDYKKQVIPDIISLPAIGGMVVLKWYVGTLDVTDLIAVGIVLVVFIVPIVFGMVFGGGDIRFGVLCALFLGLKPLGIFIALAGVVHLMLLMVLRKKSFAFAPAMSIAAVSAYMVSSL